ncbi:hypothetical protein SAMN05660653_00171 [Desulfonatronum thiosulfatophilum]|uniref:Lipoprotein-attachment site-containing protein n=1 Tax=Desulfonatronum thiosulfatophilum TaxID=617002 RepID=A0A1G6A5P0_9BACT|nr:hypothetical protein [Desulfonatronum thiosulfatophilum]SDB03747.1 hypothetical protein SAMN05660653_00171 [Desulfonatronum thiosulfatophilum]
MRVILFLIILTLAGCSGTFSFDGNWGDRQNVGADALGEGLTHETRPEDSAPDGGDDE